MGAQTQYNVVNFGLYQPLQAQLLCEHHFIKNGQAAYFEHLKLALPEDNALVLLDFAENYSFLIQDAIQGYHWNNSQATLHPFLFTEGTTRF